MAPYRCGSKSIVVRDKHIAGRKCAPAQTAFARVINRQLDPVYHYLGSQSQSLRSEPRVLMISFYRHATLLHISVKQSRGGCPSFSRKGFPGHQCGSWPNSAKPSVPHSALTMLHGVVSFTNEQLTRSRSLRPIWRHLSQTGTLPTSFSNVTNEQRGVQLMTGKYQEFVLPKTRSLF